jgi:hypothetical protein
VLPGYDVTRAQGINDAGVILVVHTSAKAGRHACSPGIVRLGRHSRSSPRPLWTDGSGLYKPARTPTSDNVDTSPVPDRGAGHGLTPSGRSR